MYCMYNYIYLLLQKYTVIKRLQKKQNKKHQSSRLRKIQQRLRTYRQ